MLRRAALLAALSASASVRAARSSSASQIRSGSSTPEPPASVAPVEPARLLFDSRPDVDYGLRYSSNDWFINFISTPTSFILRRIKVHVLFNVIIAGLVAYFFPSNPNLSIPMVGHSLLASSLGLLLSYRTNSAYARFWEGRGQWTKSKATCRNLALLIVTHVAPHSPKASAKFLKLLAAWPSTLMHLCLGGAAKLSEDAQTILGTGMDEVYRDQPAYPAMDLSFRLQACVHDMASESRTSQRHFVEAAHLTAASHMLESLLESASNCEKILRTPVPWTYSRHTSRFLTLYMATLPFALVKTLGPWLTVVVAAFTNYLMLGIEEIGHLIEQPFVGDPLDGEHQLWSVLDEDGEASALIKRGRKTQPYDIGIPVCSLAMQMRDEIVRISSVSQQH